MVMNNKIKIIGLSGKAGTGKDYISQTVLRPMGYLQFSLAWHFKISVVGKSLATHEEVFVTKPPHVRRELQLEGTERGRYVYGEDIWCKTAAEWISILHETWGIHKFVIPDVRFPNEVNFIKNAGGKVLRIVAPEREAKNGLSAEDREHISEIALDNFSLDEYDGLIYNDPEYSPTIRQQVLSSIYEYNI